MNFIAYVIIFAWSVWAILHPQVKDGIVGKFIFSCIAFSAMSAAFGSTSEMLHVSLAALGMRHMCIKHLWPRALSKFRCVMCPLHQQSKEEHF